MVSKTMILDIVKKQRAETIVLLTLIHHDRSCDHQEEINEIERASFGHASSSRFTPGNRLKKKFNEDLAKQPMNLSICSNLRIYTMPIHSKTCFVKKYLSSHVHSGVFATTRQ